MCDFCFNEISSYVIEGPPRVSERTSEEPVMIFSRSAKERRLGDRLGTRVWSLALCVEQCKDSSSLAPVLREQEMITTSKLLPPRLSRNVFMFIRTILQAFLFRMKMQGRGRWKEREREKERDWGQKSGGTRLEGKLLGEREESE